MFEIQKKRAEIPQPAPVLIDGVRYVALPWGKARGLGQNGGIVAAQEVTTGRELWVLQVYKVSSDATIEGDKQDRHIEVLAAQRPHHLRVVGERGAGTYLVDLRDRTVARLIP